MADFVESLNQPKPTICAAWCTESCAGAEPLNAKTGLCSSTVSPGFPPDADKQMSSLVGAPGCDFQLLNRGLYLERAFSAG